MARRSHYSPGIDRFLVTVLYHEAQRQRVPMTKLTNQLLEGSLKDSPAWKMAERQWQEAQSQKP